MGHSSLDKVDVTVDVCWLLYVGIVMDVTCFFSRLLECQASSVISDFRASSVSKSHVGIVMDVTCVFLQWSVKHLLSLVTLEHRLCGKVTSNTTAKRAR